MDYLFKLNADKKDYKVHNLKRKKIHLANRSNVEGIRSCLKKLKDNINNL